MSDIQSHSLNSSVRLIDYLHDQKPRGGAYIYIGTIHLRTVFTLYEGAAFNFIKVITYFQKLSGFIVYQASF